MLFFRPNIPELKARKAIPGLIRAILKRGKKPWLSEAMTAINEVSGLLKEQATGPLESALPDAMADSWDGLTELIIRCLGRTGDPKAFDVLLPLLGRHESVIHAFGDLGDKRAVPLLMRKLEELVKIQENEPPVSMQDVMAGRPRP